MTNGTNLCHLDIPVTRIPEFTVMKGGKSLSLKNNVTLKDLPPTFPLLFKLIGVRLRSSAAIYRILNTLFPEFLSYRFIVLF